MNRICGYCKYFNNDPLVLEDTFKGINILSSVHGCSRGDAGICALYDLYLLPSHTCPDFQQRARTMSEIGAAPLGVL
jgi:hypothetical protein